MCGVCAGTEGTDREGWAWHPAVLGSHISCKKDQPSSPTAGLSLHLPTSQLNIEQKWMGNASWSVGNNPLGRHTDMVPTTFQMYKDQHTEFNSATGQ